MDIIRSYVENAFAAYASTPQMRDLKEEILANMEEKYEEMKRQGHSENEAVGAVISEFGNIGELVSELGLDQGRAGFAAAAPQPGQRLLTEGEAADYLAEKRKNGLLIALGVALCILSPSFAVLTEGLHIIQLDMAVSFSVPLLFLLVAAAVFLFIVAGMRVQKNEAAVRGAVCGEELAGRLKRRQSAFQTRFAVGIGIGVVLCILSVVPAVVFSQLDSASYAAENLAPALMFVMVAAGVFCFVFLGIEADGYKKLLHPQDYAAQGEARPKTRGERAVEIVSSIYWCLVTAAYLLWSFATYDWGRSWIIWPVAGVLFGAVAAIVKACVKDDTV